jgi:hypothetical protein
MDRLIKIKQKSLKRKIKKAADTPSFEAKKQKFNEDDNSNIVLKEIKPNSHKRKIKTSTETPELEEKKQKLNPNYDDNACDDRIHLYPIEQQNLLLAYTYFLDKLMTIHITVGYECENFEPVILIRQSGSCDNIKFTPEEWKTFYTHMQEKDKYSVDIKKILSVKKCDTLIQLKQKNVIFLTNLNSYNNMINLLGHVDYIFRHYIETKKMNTISAYYKRIIYEIIENEVDFLKLNDFVEESHFSRTINYKRLYNEMLIFCEAKIKRDVFFEKLVKDIKV